MILNTILRSIFSLLLLQLLAKKSGPKQISQLSFYDYIVGITIGSIAAVLAVDDQIPWYVPAIAMIVYTIINIFFAWITTKSIHARKYLTGNPYILIFHGKIMMKNLEKVHFDINDLLTQCRSSGYFDISKIEFAIMETSGVISFMLKSEYNPLTPQDKKMKMKQEELFADIIIDGKIMIKNLKSIGKDETWLFEQLKNTPVKGVLLAIANQNNEFHFFLKDEKINQENYFI